MKKMFTMLTTFGLISLTMVGNAQAQTKNGKVNGTVTASEKPVDAATVNLLKAKDSSIVKIAVSAKDGKFELEKLPNGKYLVSVTSVGHAKYYSEKFELTDANNSYAVKPVSLAVADKQLGDVTVTSKKPLIEQKIDRTIVNVEASVTSVGSTALEVLEKSPGISVDKDGNISLKGKSGVVVLIDGKPSYLGAADLANMLKSMTASQLDQIEIMTNPPAKFDASGNAGVINIKTKKTKIKGLNGSITATYGQGIYPKASQSVNMNYRDGKWNLFGNYSYNHRQGFQNLSIDRNFIDKSTKQLVSQFSQTAIMNNENNSHSGKLGADFFATKNTTYGFVVTGFQSASNRTSENTTLIQRNTGELTNITKASSPSSDLYKNLTTNFNFRHQFDSTGKELTADLDYAGYDVKNYGRLMNSYFSGNNTPILPGDTLDSNLPTKISIYSGKLDYTHPLKGGAKFEAGFKTSFVETDNNAQFDSLLNNKYKPDYNRSNHFIYKENINAAYVNYSKQLKKWGFQLGLRVENTHAKGNQLGNVARPASSFDTVYTQLFPTAYVSYKLNDKNQFVLNYGRRINRPDYQALNPFVRFIDRYTFEQGNPGLKPQFSHNIELSHMLMGGAITTTLNYTRVTNIIQGVIEQNTKDTTTFVKQANIAQLDQFGIAVSAQLPIKKWWTMNFYANGYNNRFRGIVNNAQVDLSNPTLMFNASNTFKLGKGWTAELSGFYRTKGLEGVMLINPMGMISSGVSKSILKNKGTIRFNIRDMFWLQRPNGSAKYDDVDVKFRQYSDNRVANISFTYRFSKGKVGNTQRKRSSVDEADRVKLGGN